MHKEKKEQGTYTPNQLQQAYNAVIVQQQSVHKSAALFGVPFHVLRDKVENSPFPFKVRSKKPDTNKKTDVLPCDLHPMLIQGIARIVLMHLKPQERLSAACTCSIWYEMLNINRKRDLIQAKRKDQLVAVALYNTTLEWVQELFQNKSPKEILSAAIKSNYKNRVQDFDWDATLQIYQKQTCNYNAARSVQNWYQGHSPVLLFTVTYWNSYNNFDWAAAIREESIKEWIVGDKKFMEIRKIRPVHCLCCESGYVPSGYHPSSGARVIPTIQFKSNIRCLTLLSIPENQTHKPTTTDN